MIDILTPFEKLKEKYKLKTLAQVSEAFDIPIATLSDNYTKAKKEYKLLQDIKHETNPVKKELMQKQIDNTTKKRYTNALYPKIVEFAIKKHISLDWLFADDDFDPLKNKTSNHIKIPFYSEIKASAGGGYVNDDNIQPDFIEMPKSIFSGNNLNAIKVYGDSMLPNIAPDSIVFVDLDQTEIKKDYVYVLRYEDEIFIKRLEMLDGFILLRSDNIAYTTISAKKEDVHIIGLVVKTL